MCKTIELRDQIALEAMKLALADSVFYEDAEDVAKNCYALADAMMAARATQTAVNLSGQTAKVTGPAYDGVGLTAVEYVQGWRSWDGEGVPPARPEQHVQVRLRDDGEPSDPYPCHRWDWEVKGNASDIVAYRVVKA